LSRQELDIVFKEYRDMVQSEFMAFRPPIQSGADAIYHLVQAFVNETPVFLSGRSDAKGHFVSGTFSPKELRFVPVQIIGVEAERLQQEIIKQHETIMSEVRL
jgi:hypothetical protein